MDELLEDIAIPPVEELPDESLGEEELADVESPEDWTESDLDEEIGSWEEPATDWQTLDPEDADDAAENDSDTAFWATVETMEEQGLYREADMLKMQYATAIAKQQLLSELAPQLASLNTFAVESAIKDLDPTERDYIERVFVQNGIGYDVIAASPLLKEVARDAARGWQGRQATGPMPGGESMGGFSSFDMPTGAWSDFREAFGDLNPSREEFERIAREGQA